MRYFELLKESNNQVVEQACEMLIESIDWSGGDGETVMCEIGLGADDIDEEAHPEKDEIDKRIKSWAWTKCAHFEWQLENMFSSGTLEVYREITAPKDWVPDPNRHPGICWSWSEEAAEAHWGEMDGVHWLLTATVYKNDIEWVQTIALNCHPSTGEEQEIRLKDGVPVKFTYKRKIRPWDVE